MADLADGLFARLTGSADLAALVGTRVYPLAVPAGRALPYIRYQVIGDEPLLGINDSAGGGWSEARLQVDCFAASYREARAMAAMVIAAFRSPGSSGGVRFGAARWSGPRDLGEDETEAFVPRAMVELLVRHAPTP